MNKLEMNTIVWVTDHDIIAKEIHGEKGKVDNYQLVIDTDGFEINYYFVVFDYPVKGFENGTLYGIWLAEDYIVTRDEMFDQLEHSDEQDSPTSAIHIQEVIAGKEKPDDWLIEYIIDEREEPRHV